MPTRSTRVVLRPYAFGDALEMSQSGVSHTNMEANVH